MRNLKKILALVLALVMSLSLVTIASADFSDAADIDYTEAVEVMAAAGILEGSDGKFDPKGTLTREQAAKIITYVVKGAEDADKLTAVIAPFADVAANRWSAGAIAFCASEGIIDGVGDGNFAPAAKLTGAAFAKMLLCALGFDAAKEGLTGAAWALNTAKLFVSEDLDAGLETIVLSEELTREQAAQMALNALKWTDAPETWDLKDAAGNVLGTYATKAEANKDKALMGTIAVGAGPYTVVATPTEDNLLSEVHDITCTADKDAFGRPANRYAHADWTANKVYAKAATATFTGVTAEKDVYAKLTKVDKDANNDKVIAEVYEDGVNVASNLKVNKTGKYNAPYFGNGITVELFALANDTYRIVAVREYMAKVDKVNKANETNETKRNIEVDLYSVPNGFETKVDCENYETESFAKDDKVVVTIAIDGGKFYIKSIKAIEKVENVAVTAYKQGGMDVATVTAGGVTYKYSQNNLENTASATYSIGDGTTYTFYLDSMGNILDVETYSAISTNYVYIVKTQYKNNASNLIDATAQAAKAEAIFVDGTHKTIDLAIDGKGTSAITDDTVMAPASDGTVSSATVESKKDTTPVIGTWFAYTVNDAGVYTLKQISSTYAAIADGVDFDKNASENISGKFTTSATKITAIDTKYNVTTHTGFVASDDDDLDGKVLYTYAKDSKVIVAMYAVGQAAPVAKTNYAYALSAGNYVQYGREWTFAIDGEKVTKVIATGQSVTAGNIYTLATSTNGTYTVSQVTTSGLTVVTTGVEVEIVDTGMFIAKTTGEDYYYGTTYGIYNVDADDADVQGEVDTIVAEDVVTVVEYDGKVVVVYITTAK